ncbi:MAG: hypothetical protein WA139_00970 [Candidatus Aenigmatarchaeota archaeon]
MQYDKTTYINNISELFGSKIASRMEGELDKYPGYGMKIRNRNGEGSIIFEKISYNGNPIKPSKVERIIYPIIKTQCGFDIPEARIIRQEYKNGKLTKLKE